MLRIGLTGGIASGKSEVSRRFRQLGVPVIDADQVARQVVEPGMPAFQDIVEHFGQDILDSDGKIDRTALGAIVFRDANLRSKLEAIVHPCVAQESFRWFEQRRAEGQPLAIYDVPLLFETGMAAAFDRIIVVAVRQETQIERIIQRDGLSESEARARIDAQMKTEEKVQQAHYVLWNDGTLQDLKDKVTELYKTLKTQGEAGEK